VKYDEDLAVPDYVERRPYDRDEGLPIRRVRILPEPDLRDSLPFVSLLD
jgi:hypothetical protein